MASPEHRARIVRRLGAPPERVFAAFASAQQVAQWLSPAPEIVLEVLAFDFRPGGGYRFAYHVPGGDVMRVHGDFIEIAPPARIAFSWIIEPPDEHAGIDSEVRVSIAAADGGAMLTVVHERLDQPGAVERHDSGWIAALDRLDALVRTKAPA